MEINLKVAQAYPNDSGRGIARLDPDTIRKLQLSPGDIIEIEGKRVTVAKVWRADKRDWGLDLIRIDGFTRQNAGVGIGDVVKVRRADYEPAKTIILAPLQDMNFQIFGMNVGEYLKRQILKRPIVQGDVVPIMGGPNPFIGRFATAQALPLVAVKTEPSGVVIVDESTNVVFRERPVRGFETLGRTGITYEDIGGLKEELQKVREMIELPIKHPEVFQKLGIDPPKGVLLYGPPGTGKTLIAKAVANEAGASFYSIAGPEIMSKYYGESEQRLREVFENAKENAPSIIFIDELDSIAPKRQDVTGEVERRVVAQLLSLMDGLEERGQVIVIGATNRIDAIDPALRRPGRFDREIEIGVPDRNDRKEVLQIHTRNMPLEEVDLDYLADHTHGFVGADIAALCKEAAMKALRRYLPRIDLNKEIPQEMLDEMVVVMDDFREALKEIDPSALREVFVEIPNVTWDNVGGMEDVKREITEAVEWPIKHPDKFKRMGIKPPKGILLYGPPGTGKTLIAKAVANESDANFISIRGPQLVSKWVGETEKGIRETFRKAKQVAPCIIFFDEIDAIAPMRGMDEGTRVMERVVNQLLTEMDGLEELEGVVVVGATNRPDILDPALLRPGRFDRMVYVRPPDKQTRVDIFRIHLKDTPLSDDVDIHELAELTEGYVGADIEAICREAAMLALREDINAELVEMRHFREAIKKVKPSITENLLDFYDRITERFREQAVRGTKNLVGYT
jgi:transitional endoplasmic reticulum ATPase